MRGLYIPPAYLKKCLLFVCLFGFIALGAIGGCSDNGGGQNNTRALTENDFANNDSLRGDPEGGVIVTFLESPDSVAPENDTGGVGIDEIPLTYKQNLEQTICWEDEDVDAMHFMELKDSEGNEVLRVDVNGDCVTEVIDAGDYVMTFHHDGRMEDSQPIFIIPNHEDTEQAGETDGLINRFKVAAVNILRGIQKSVTKDAKAQTVQDNIDTLIKTRMCPDCDLHGADLSGNDLQATNLSGANLRDANLSGADLDGALLWNAVVNSANLTGTSFFNAQLDGADLYDADLTDANLTVANLTDAYLGYANLTDADLQSADLSGADLIGANLTGAVFSSATWCNTCTCANPSVGSCVGCPPPEVVCTGP